MKRAAPAAGRGTRPVRAAQPALLLRRFPYGESSLVLHALTPESGRVALLAKGAYRPSSGYCAVFDLFDTLDVRWNTGSGQELGLVTRASLRTRRAGLAFDLERYRPALSLLELAGLAAREGHEERQLFRWLEGGLDLLLGGRAEPRVVTLASDLAWLRDAGLAPALEHCASCGKTPEDSAAGAPFSAALGGRLCTPCGADAQARGRPIERLPLNVLRVAASLMHSTPAVLEHTRIAAGLLGQVQAFVQRFLEYQLEQRLKSRASLPPRPPPR